MSNINISKYNIYKSNVSNFNTFKSNIYKSNISKSTTPNPPQNRPSGLRWMATMIWSG